MARESCTFNEGNPLSARESKGNPPSGLISNIVDYFYADGLSEPLPHYYTIYSEDPIEAILSTF